MLSENKTNGLWFKTFAYQQDPNRERLNYLQSKNRAHYLTIFLFENISNGL